MRDQTLFALFDREKSKIIADLRETARKKSQLWALSTD